MIFIVINPQSELWLGFGLLLMLEFILGCVNISLFFTEPNCFSMLKSIPTLLIHGEPFFFSFVPRCDTKSGYFLPEQCSKDESECWCVSKLGKEIKNTRSKGHVSCSV